MHSNYTKTIGKDGESYGDVMESYGKGSGRKYEKNYSSLQINKEKYSIGDFKCALKREHMKQLNQYKKSLDDKIELLKAKINKESCMTDYNTLTFDNKNRLQRIRNKFNHSPINPSYISFKTKILEKEKICIYFIAFLNSNELFRLVNCKQEIKKIIVNVIINKLKETIIPKFALKYSVYSPIFDKNKISYFLALKNYKKSKKIHLRIILLIKATINSDIGTDISGKFYQIGFTQSSSLLDKEKAINTFQFQILTINNKEAIPHNIDLLKQKHFWIHREKTDFHFDELNRSHYNPVQQFHTNDIAVFNISIFSEMGLINFNDFHWIRMKEIKQVNNNNVICEVERIINYWGDLRELKDSFVIAQSINEIFKDYFEVVNIRFDDVGYYIFKITIKAKKKGIIKAKDNEYIGMDITIGNIGDVIENEVKKNGLIYDEINKLNINVNDVIEFYFSKSK